MFLAKWPAIRSVVCVDLMTKMEFQSHGVDNAIFLQWLQICTSSSGVSKTSTLTNSSSGRHSTLRTAMRLSSNENRSGSARTSYQCEDPDLLPRASSILDLILPFCRNKHPKTFNVAAIVTIAVFLQFRVQRLSGTLRLPLFC